MPKKHKRDRHQPTPAAQDIPAVVTQSEIDEAEREIDRELSRDPSMLTEMLEAIRADAKATRDGTARTIADLETMRAEIDAAIAFLKAGRR